MNKRRKILAAMLAAFMLLVPMVSTAQIKVDDEETSDLSGTWGTVQITDYQTEEYVPLGEGLWLLAGAAGLYLLVKSRKTRKATAVAAAALALTLGSTQCKKTEESVIPAGETISISFMAGNGAKSDIDVYTGRITWETDDEVYVVYNGQLLSEKPLLATPDPKNSVNANIKGTITTTVTIEGDKPSFTFYYVGSGVIFNKTNFTFDIHNQNGINAGHYMVGRTEPVEMKVKEGTENSYEPTQDDAKHFDPLTSVLRLNTSEFGANQSLTMDGGNNLMTGDATPSYTAGSITFTSGEDVRISVIPTTPAGDVTLSFSGNGKVGSITVKNGIKEGRIYSKVINNAGYPIHVDANESGALPGLFTVSDNGTPDYATDDIKVYFSKGNLQYLGNSDGMGTWRFAENQWDYMGAGPSATSNTGNVDLSSFGYSNYNTTGGSVTSVTKAAARDMFGWGCTGYQDTRKDAHRYQYNYQPYSTSSKVVDRDINYWGYGPDFYSSNKYNLTVESKSDWGCVTGLPSAGGGKSWRTLSSGEWYYLLYKRTTTTTGLPESSRYAKVTVNGVSGMLLFPDSFAWTSAMGTAPTKTNNTSAEYTTGSYSAAEFTEQEKSGVVFLPAAGGRGDESLGNVGSKGFYWTSTCTGSNMAYGMYFSSEKIDFTNLQSRFYGSTVRLVSAN